MPGRHYGRGRQYYAAQPSPKLAGETEVHRFSSREARAAWIAERSEARAITRVQALAIHRKPAGGEYYEPKVTIDH